MAKLFPSRQSVVDHVGNTTIIVSTVKILTSGSDHLDLPITADVGFLHTTRAVSDPTFYLTQSGDQLAIEGATVGTTYTVVSRHEGGTNFDRGDNAPASNNPL